MLNEWTFFKDVDFNDSTILQYHIDTRDFHCLSNDETPTELPDINTLKKYMIDSFIQ